MTSGLALRAAAMQAGEYAAFRRIVAVLAETWRQTWPAPSA